MIISVPCQDKENFPVQLFMPNEEINCTEISTHVPVEINADELVNNAEVEEKEMEPNATIYYNDGMDLTTFISTQIIPFNSQEDDCIIENDDILSKPSNNDTKSEELNLPSEKFFLKTNGNIKDIGINLSTDLTQGISTILAAGVTTSKDSENIKQNHECSDLTKNNYSNTAVMEFTSFLPSSTWVRADNVSHLNHYQNSERINFNKTKNMNMSMELTEPLIGSQVCKKSLLMSKENAYSSKSLSKLAISKDTLNDIQNETRSLENKFAQSSASIRFSNQAGTDNEERNRNIEEKTSINKDSLIEISGSHSTNNKISPPNEGINIFLDSKVTANMGIYSGTLSNNIVFTKHF